MTTLVWLRNDLRVDDQPALAAAVARGGGVVPVYVHAPDEEGSWPPGAASRWWLHHSLLALGDTLQRLGGRLVVRVGESLAELRAVATQVGAEAIVWNRRVEPAATRRDRVVAAALARDGLDVQSFDGGLLFPPEQIRTRKGTPYRVFTPYWRACLTDWLPDAPWPAVSSLPPVGGGLASVPIERLDLLPRVDWASGLRARWTPGERGARATLNHFVEGGLLEQYPDVRDRPDRAGTSRLSAHLHFGEISPRRVWHAVRSIRSGPIEPRGSSAVELFLRQLGWREFAHHLLAHFPQTTDAPLRPEWSVMPWRHDPDALQLWQRGRTGFPIVDAAMRQLWETGWMHNRLRMVVASFLVKDLLIPWQEGARWFWDTLVDADLANNTLGWQWTAGCGADAAPYFRIFNPVAQGERFDPDGAFVRRHVPELGELPARWIHRPWEAPAPVRERAGLRLGEAYPEPIVEHSRARRRALEAYEHVKRQR